MKKTFNAKMFLLFSMVLIVPTKGFPEEVLVKSGWRSSPLNIDGSAGDWEGVTMNSVEKVSVDYAFMNDAENLFVVFEIKDRKHFSSINFTGLTIWFNTDGKKKKYYSITFRKKAVTAEFYLSYLEGQGQKVSEEDKQKIRSMNSILFYDASVTNKKSKAPSQSPENPEIKPAIFRSNDQKKMMVYELSVPLAKVTEMSPGIGIEPGKTVKICFEWGGMTDELRKRMIERQMASSGNRTTGVADSNPREGVGVPRQGQSPKKYSVWVDVQLAKNEQSEGV